MQLQVLSAQKCHRQYPHDTGFRVLPWALIQYVDTGPYCLDTGQQCVTLQDGEAWILPPKISNRIRAPAIGTVIQTTWIHFRCQLDDGSDIFDHYTFPLHIPQVNARGLCQSMDELLYWQKRMHQSIPDQVRFEKRTYMFLEQLLSLGEKIQQAAHPRSADMIAMMQHVNQTLDQIWDRNRMARFLNLSASRFHDVFKAVTAQSPSSWLRHQRIDHAKDLLAHSSMSIQDIARDCGFEDPYHFSRVFKQAEQVSPRAWRQKLAI